MKRILVPTDFSPSAEAATSMALLLAKQSGASIFFLHIAEDLVSEPHVVTHTTPAVATQDPKTGLVKAQLNACQQRADQLSVPSHVQLVMSRGYDHIEDYLEPNQIDFIVMGSHGGGKLRRLILGSKTHRLIRRTNVPMLIVKEVQPGFRPRSVLMASRFNHDLSLAVAPVLELAKVWNLQLHLICVKDDKNRIDETEGKKRMEQFIRDYHVDNASVNMVETNDTEWAIRQTAAELEADIVALVVDASDPEIEDLPYHIVDHLIQHEDRPVLVTTN